MIKIIQTKEFGRGLFSTQKIKNNTTLFLCEILILSPEDTKIVNTTQLQYYTFKYNDSEDCLVLGHGEIFNHSDVPNVSYQLVDVKCSVSGITRKVMEFKTNKDINSNEQLFIDYQSDCFVSVDQYKNAKSMI